LSNVSIGYSVSDGDYEIVERNEKPFVTVKRWQPYEVSIVTVPADVSVGFGRSLLERLQNKETETPPFVENPINDNSHIEINEVNSMESSDVLAQERERVTALTAMNSEYQMPEGWLERHISNGTDLDAARKEVLETLRQRAAAAAAPTPELGLSAKEKREFSLVRIIRQKLAQQGIDGFHKYVNDAGLEMEINQTLHDKYPNRGAEGVLLPLADLPNPIRNNFGLRQRLSRLYSGGSPASGGLLIDTVLDAGNFIEALRALQFLTLAGARVLSGLVGDVDIPRRATVGTTVWVGEGGTINTNIGSFDKVELRYKSIASLVTVTRRMLIQATPDIEELIRFDMLEEIARGVDRAALVGTGGVQPTGILNLPGTGEVTNGANGGAPTWAKMVEMITKVAEKNAITGNQMFVMGAKLAGKLYTTEKSANTAQFVLDHTNVREPFLPYCGSILMYPVLCSNLVPENLTKGTGTNLSAVVFGDFSQALIGEWGPLDFVVNPLGAGFQEGNLQIRCMHACDIAFRRPDYFSICKDFSTN